MSDSQHQTIELYSKLADDPTLDFGWDKGLENAKAHQYKEEWFEALPKEIWQYCAAVGNPFSLGKIEQRMRVVDLGCGAGVDVLIAAHLVGEEGEVIGVDITPKMVQKAREHAELAGFNNVKVLESSFDAVAIEDESVDVVISNGAINLTPCKESVFAEIYRILKPEGKIYFADMIDISEENSCCSLEATTCCESEEEDWANCVAGTMRQEELIKLIQDAGFKAVECTALTHYTTVETTQGATFVATKQSANVRRQMHWESIYQKADYTQVLWHQRSAEQSFSYIQSSCSPDEAVIDVGSGASLLVDQLVEHGYNDITLLDTAQQSLQIVKERLASESTTFIVEDVLEFDSNKRFSLWHDRAVFHFLRTPNEQKQYFSVLDKHLHLGGHAIISTFAIDGPNQCAGLEVQQYDLDTMNKLLPKNLTLTTSEKFIHITPKKSEQMYIYFVILKVKA